MSTIAGKYEFDSATSVEEYLTNLGVGLVLRKVLMNSKPTLEISYSPDTDEWNINTETPFKSYNLRFKIGQRVEDETYDARKCMTIGSIVDNKIVLEQICDEGPNVTVVKEQVQDQMLKVTMTADNVPTTHLFRKV